MQDMKLALTKVACPVEKGLRGLTPSHDAVFSRKMSVASIRLLLVYVPENTPLDFFLSFRRNFKTQSKSLRYSFPSTAIFSIGSSPHFSPRRLDELLESAVDRGADVGHILPEVDGCEGALRDTFGSELEFLLHGQYNLFLNSALIFVISSPEE
jgi:hypothetical protein